MPPKFGERVRVTGNFQHKRRLREENGTEVNIAGGTELEAKKIGCPEYE